MGDYFVDLLSRAGTLGAHGWRLYWELYYKFHKVFIWFIVLPWTDYSRCRAVMEKTWAYLYWKYVSQRDSTSSLSDCKWTLACSHEIIWGNWSSLFVRILWWWSNLEFCKTYWITQPKFRLLLKWQIVHKKKLCNSQVPIKIPEDAFF